MKAISGAEVSSSNTFVVRKRLNAFEDGPRVFILDLQEQCIVNEIYTDLHDISKQAGQKGKSKKAGINSGASKVRKKIPFEIIKRIIPHGRPRALGMKARPETGVHRGTRMKQGGLHLPKLWK